MKSVKKILNEQLESDEYDKTVEGNEIAGSAHLNLEAYTLEQSNLDMSGKSA